MTDTGARVRRRAFANADGIRGLACLIVLCTHTVAWFFQPVGNYLGGVGKIGVWLFFVLSAFLLSNHLLEGPLTARKMADYVLGRLLRIMPLYILAVMVYRLAGTAGIDTMREVRAALTLRGGFAHLWTIPVEMKFYLLLALLIVPLRIASGRLGPWSAVALLAAGSAIGMITFPPDATPANSIELRWYVPCFAAGVATALVYPLLRPVRRRWTLLAHAIFALGLVAASYPVRALFERDAYPNLLSNAFVPIGIGWAILVALDVDRAGATMRFYNHALLRCMGRWSYPIYLMHWLIVVSLATRFQGNVGMAVLAVVASVLCGGLLHRCIEGPLLSARARMRRSAMPAERIAGPSREDRV